MNTRSFLISEFSNTKRVDILKILSSGSVTFSELSKELNISSSEVSRHLSRLTDQNFIQKQTQTRKFELTPLGELVIHLFSPLDFVFSKVDYFKAHRVTDLPTSLIRDIDILSSCELISGTGYVMSKVPEVFNSTQREIRVMTDQPFPWGKPDLDVKYIVPCSMMKLREQVDDVNKSSDARILPHVSIALIITDVGEGMIFFPNLEGNPDFSTVFYVNKDNSIGQEYLERIWDYFWETGDIPDS